MIDPAVYRPDLVFAGLGRDRGRCVSVPAPRETREQDRVPTPQPPRVGGAVALRPWIQRS